MLEKNKRGFILILTFILLAALVLITAAFFFIISNETVDVGGGLDDYKLLNLADAGVERAHREIRDDYLTTTQTGTSDLRGNDTTGSVDGGGSADLNESNVRWLDGNVATLDDNADIVYLGVFDSNYTNTRITASVQVFARARRGGGDGANPTMEVAYTTDGATYTSVISQSVTGASLANFSGTVGVSLTWPTMMSSNFKLRVRRTAGARSLLVDALWVRVTYGIDTLTEPWATASYTTFPISLGSGTIDSILMVDKSETDADVSWDECGKVHLNYANQTLLSNLFQERGIAAGTADTLATNIVNYRGVGLTNPFDSVEELMQVTGMTTTDYDKIKNYVTVYSFVNSNVSRPAGPRAPININTAPREVLEAIFDPLGLGASDPASLATDIINTRPFVGFYSATSSSNTYFYNFVTSRPYLSTAGNPDEEDKVLDNADASLLVPVSGSTAFDALTTEFCYASTVFKINSLANVSDRKFRVKTLVGNDGSHTFTTYTGDTSSLGWRSEEFIQPQP